MIFCNPDRFQGNQVVKIIFMVYNIHSEITDTAYWRYPAAT